MNADINADMNADMNANTRAVPNPGGDDTGGIPGRLLDVGQGIFPRREVIVLNIDHEDGALAHRFPFLNPAFRPAERMRPVGPGMDVDRPVACHGVRPQPRPCPARRPAALSGR